MNNDIGAIQKTIESIFQDASNELFSGYKLTQSHSVKHTETESHISGDSLVSLLSASGDGIKLLATIKMSTETARYIHPRNHEAISLDDLQDLGGELNNQLVGKIKNKLLSYDCKVLLGLPTFIRGNNIENSSIQNATVANYSYACPAGLVLVSVHTVIHPAFTMLDTPNEDLSGNVSEGMLDFF